MNDCLNMIEKEFQAIANKLGAIYYKEEEIIDMGGGERCPHIIYLLTLEYKGLEIKINNSTGVSAIGRVECKFLKESDSLVFDMTTRSHFLSLFFKSNRFKFTNLNPNLEQFVKNSIGLNQMKGIAKETSFEPTIIGENTNVGYRLIIEYSLLFDDWTQVVEPMIIFYKEFIDKFK